MTSPLSPDELLSRYVHEVARRLPHQSRDDVARELESLLREAMEERLETSGPDSASEAAAIVLKEFGAPDTVALRYAPKPNYLIGPTVYPTFRLTLKTAIFGAFLLAALVTVVQAVVGSLESPIAAAWLYLTLFWRLAFGFSVVAVLVFAVLERLAPEEFSKSTDRGWDPFSLPAVEESPEVAMVETYAALYGTVLLLLWFNFFPDWVGLFLVPEPSGIRLLTPDDLGFTLPLTLINLWWTASIFKNILLIRNRRWTPGTRWFEFGLGLGGALIFGLIFADALAAVQTETFSAALGRPALTRILSRVIPGATAVIVVLLLSMSVRRLFRLLRPRSPLPPEVGS